MSEFVQIFSEMGWVCGILLSVGILFCIIEIFIPGLGFFGISGTVLVIAGIIARIVEGASATQIAIMVGLFILIVTVLFLLMLYSARYGLLGRTAIIEKGTAVSKNYFLQTRKLEKLIGKTGITVNEMNLGGKIRIGDTEYNARTLDNIIPEGTKVQVTKIVDGEIIVKRV